MTSEQSKIQTYNKIAFAFSTVSTVIVKACAIFTAILLYQLQSEMAQRKSLAFMASYLPGAKKTLKIVIVLYICAFILNIVAYILQMLSSSSFNKYFESLDEEDKEDVSSALLVSHMKIL